MRSIKTAGLIGFSVLTLGFALISMGVGSWSSSPKSGAVLSTPGARTLAEPGKFRFLIDAETGGPIQEIQSFSIKTETNVLTRDPLSVVVENVAAKLSAESRATIDLLILRSRDGKEVLVPRFVVRRHGIKLSYDSAKEALSFAPNDALKAKLFAEGLPANQYKVDNLAEIELSSFKARFKPVFLTKRTDPAAVRGEKIFVQRCIACHADQSKLDPVEALKPHPPVEGYRAMPEPETRALRSYFAAVQSQAPVSTP